MLPPVPAIPLSSLHVTKRTKCCPLPETFIAVVKQGSIHSAVGIIEVTSVHEYETSDESSKQYLSYVQQGLPVDTSKYVTWHVKRACAIVDQPLILDHSVFAISSHIVGKPFAESTMNKLMLRSICPSGSMDSVVSLRALFGNPKFKIRSFRISDPTWQDLAQYKNTTNLVTPLTALYHAGISQEDVVAAVRNTGGDDGGAPKLALSEPLQGSLIRRSSAGSNAGAINSQKPDCELDSSSSSDDDDKQKRGSLRYSFDVMWPAMELALQMKNATHIKQAVRSALAIVQHSSQVLNMIVCACLICSLTEVSTS